METHLYSDGGGGSDHICGDVAWSIGAVTNLWHVHLQIHIHTYTWTPTPTNIDTYTYNMNKYTSKHTDTHLQTCRATSTITNANRCIYKLTLTLTNTYRCTYKQAHVHIHNPRNQQAPENYR